MATFFIPELEAQKATLVNQAHQLLEKKPSSMERVLLTSSLMKLGVKVDSCLNLEEVERFKFYPFIGAPFAPFENKLFQRLAAKKLAIINWECDAVKWAYCIENMVLRRYQ